MDIQKNWSGSGNQTEDQIKLEMGIGSFLNIRNVSIPKPSKIA